jgi:hypothetical protein
VPFVPGGNNAGTIHPITILLSLPLASFALLSQWLTGSTLNLIALVAFDAARHAGRYSLFDDLAQSHRWRPVVIRLRRARERFALAFAHRR